MWSQRLALICIYKYVLFLKCDATSRAIVFPLALST